MRNEAYSFSYYSTADISHYHFYGGSALYGTLSATMLVCEKRAFE